MKYNTLFASPASSHSHGLVTGWSVAFLTFERENVGTYPLYAAGVRRVVDLSQESIAIMRSRLGHIGQIIRLAADLLQLSRSICRNMCSAKETGPGNNHLPIWAQRPNGVDRLGTCRR